MSETKHQAQLRSCAEYCLRQYAGILTPTGRPKKPPTYYIMECDDHGLTLTFSKMPKDKRFTCQYLLYVPEGTKNNASPHSKVCGNQARVIEEVTA